MKSCSLDTFILDASVSSFVRWLELSSSSCRRFEFSIFSASTCFNNWSYEAAAILGYPWTYKVKKDFEIHHWKWRSCLFCFEDRDQGSKLSRGRSGACVEVRSPRDITQAPLVSYEDGPWVLGEENRVKAEGRTSVLFPQVRFLPSKNRTSPVRPTWQNTTIDKEFV